VLPRSNSPRQPPPTSAQLPLIYANGVQRVDGSRLKEMFLPRITPKTKQLLRRERDFVRGQLQHYGVRDDTHDAFGSHALNEQG
jgi:hypothetical protein